MKISIIVPVLINSPTTKDDNWIWLKKCVSSLKKNSKENHEILVVTNNGKPKEVPIKGIKVIHNTPQGQCQAVNLGVKEAKHDYVMIIDEDMVFPIGWEELIEKAQEYPFVSGTLMERGGSFVNNPCGGLMDFNEQKFETDAKILAKKEWENGFGFPLICKKKVWEMVEGYDEQFDPWGSNVDSDLEYKLMLAGIMPKRWKGTLVYHFAQVSGTFAEENMHLVQANISKFERKWGFARARSPEIWSCDFTIPKGLLKYKPKWAKLEDNPYIKADPIKQNISLDHVGWISNKPDLFEKFWCDIVGFEKVHESMITPEMSDKLFGISKEMVCRRYKRGNIQIEIHIVDVLPETHYFTRWGINHICLWVDDRHQFLKCYDFDFKIYDNPKGHQNIFIKDFEGNWIELKQTL